MIVSKASVNARLKTVTITKAWVAPRTESGVPVRKRPRNSRTNAVNIAGENRYLSINDKSKKRPSVIAPSLSVPTLKRMLPAAPSREIAINTPQTTYLSNSESRLA